MPTLLQINVTANWGSTGKIAEQIGQCAIKNGWTSYIAYRWNYHPSMSKLIRVSGKYGIYFHYLGNFLLDKEGLFSSRDTKQLITRIKEIKPDVIHLHNIHDHWLNYKLLFEYLNQTDIKIVWTFHDCWAFTGHCAYFDYSGCEKWKTCCKQCPSLKEYPPCFGVDQSKRNFELKKKLFTGLDNMVIVTPSQWLADLVKESFLAEYPVRVVHNDINHSVFHQNVKPAILPDNLKSKRIILGVASIWEKRKGLADFLALSKLISDEYQIVLVGLSKYQIKQLPENVTGITHTADAKELASLYAVADVFVNLTYEDNYPTTNLEAQACGTPVISYETGGSTESAREYGIVVKKGDLSAVASIINNKKYLECRDCRSNHAFLEEYANIYMNNHMDKERSVME